MRKIRLTSSLTIALLGITLMTGCGGSSSGEKASAGNGGALDTQSVEKLTRNAAELIPGCSYQGATLSSSPDPMQLQAYRNVVDTLKIAKRGKKDVRATQINEQEDGSCGGTLTTTGTHNNGDEDVQYVFNNYCTSYGSTKTTVNGTLNVKTDGTPTPDGPEIQELRASTGGDGIVTTTVTGSETTTESFFLDNLDYKVGQPATITLQELRIHQDNQDFKLTNLNMEMSESESDGYIQVKSATYYDPEIGSVSMQTNRIPINPKQGDKAEITITRGGTTATLTSSDPETGKFDVIQNGKRVGALDCSASLTSVK